MEGRHCLLCLQSFQIILNKKVDDLSCNHVYDGLLMLKVTLNDFNSKNKDFKFRRSTFIFGWLS